MSYNELKQHGTLDFPIELYHIDKNHPKYEMASHWHTHIEIIRILEGEFNVKLYNNEYQAKKGDVIFVNSETVHGAYPTDCIYECIVMHLEMLSVKDAACRHFIDGLLNQEYKIQEFIHCSDNEFHTAVNNLFCAMNHPSKGYKFTVIGTLFKLFGIIIDNNMYYNADADTEVPKDKNILKLKKVLTFIRNNFEKPITLDNMAECAGMSPKYFCSFFKNMTRKTPVEYLNTYRVERAARKLLNSDLSVTEIAYSCGFNDLSYFIKTFKVIKGITPVKFRKFPE